MSHFLQKIADLEDILCELVEFCVLSEIHVSKTDSSKYMKSKTKRLCTHVLGTCVQNFFYSQPSKLPEDAPAKFYFSMTLGLSFMISSISNIRGGGNPQWRLGIHVSPG